MSVSSPVVLADEREKVLQLTFHRPHKKNAFNTRLYQELTHWIHDFGDSQHAVLVLTGAEGCFSSGNDIADFVQMLADPTIIASAIDDFMQALLACPKPVVAAVDGVAIGIGATLLMHCDYVIASSRARLQMPFVNLGLCPEFGASYLLPRIVGRQRAKALLMTGQELSGTQALEWGLVNEVIPADTLMPHALSKAAELAVLSSSALQATKQLLSAHESTVLHSVMQDEMAAFRTLLSSEEFIRFSQQFLEGNAHV